MFRKNKISLNELRTTIKYMRLCGWIPTYVKTLDDLDQWLLGNPTFKIDIQDDKCYKSIKNRGLVYVKDNYGLKIAYFIHMYVGDDNKVMVKVELVSTGEIKSYLETDVIMENRLSEL